MPNRFVLTKLVPALILLGTSCASPIPDGITGTWSSASAIVIATDTSVTFNFGCEGIRFSSALVPFDGAFNLHGSYYGTEMVPPPAVTVTGTISGSTMTLETRPSAFGLDTSGARFAVTRNGPLPDWWTNPGNYLCPG